MILVMLVVCIMLYFQGCMTVGLLALFMFSGDAQDGGMHACVMIVNACCELCSLQIVVNLHLRNHDSSVY